MNLKLLAISIGNSRTRLGAFEDGNLTESVTHPNDPVDPISRSIIQLGKPMMDEAPAVLSSVNPPLTARVSRIVHEQLGARLLRIDEDLPIPIGRQLDPESIVGEDRLLNAAAAYDALKQACVIVDAGTALTVDFVDGTGTFHGGAIATGASLMLTALQQSAYQLPEVELKRPDETIGHNTVQAMRTAVYHGIRGMVRELVEKYAEFAGLYPMVVATGGDAELLFEDYNLMDRIVPDLTLQGIALTLQAHAQKAES